MKQYCSLIFLLFVVSSDLLTAQEMNDTGTGITQTDTLKNEMTSQDEKGSKFKNLFKHSKFDLTQNSQMINLI